MLFNITSPAPHVGHAGRAARGHRGRRYRPNAGEFRDFVTAVGTRYSGTFQDEAARQSDNVRLRRLRADAELPRSRRRSARPTRRTRRPDNPNPPNTGPVLPRVDTWSAWNEPNMPGWLTPQSHEDDKRLAGLTARLPGARRRRCTAGSTRVGPRQRHDPDRRDGAARARPSAPSRSSLRPLLFLRELYCLDDQLPAVHGRCRAPPRLPGRRRRLPRRAPGALRRHRLRASPLRARGAAAARATRTRTTPCSPTSAASRARSTARSRRHGSNRRFKVWLTEYGYQTDPPDPVRRLAVEDAGALPRPRRSGSPTGAGACARRRSSCSTTTPRCATTRRTTRATGARSRPG